MLDQCCLLNFLHVLILKQEVIIWLISQSMLLLWSNSTPLSSQQSFVQCSFLYEISCLSFMIEIGLGQIFNITVRQCKPESTEIALPSRGVSDHSLSISCLLSVSPKFSASQSSYTSLFNVLFTVSLHLLTNPLPQCLAQTIN